MSELLAFDLLRLAWDDEAGKPSWRCSQGLPAGVAGALLLDAILADVLDIDDGRVHATQRAPEDPLLASFVEEVTRRRRPPKAKTLVGGSGGTKRMRAVRDRMVAEGLLAEREQRILWIFPTTRRYLTDPARSRALRERVRGLLAGTRDPEQAPDAEVMLAALAGATGVADLLVERSERKAAKRRAEEFADGHGVSEAVSVAIREAQAAAVAAVAGAAAASSASSGGGS